MDLDDCIGDRRPWIEVVEAGSVVGRGRSQSYALVKRGVIPSRRIGARRIVVPRLEFLRSLGVEVSK
jgi:hypothetical protein